MVTGKSQKPTRFTRFVIYPLVGLGFIIVLSIILTLANGYRFTYSSGKVGLVKTGMLIVTTRPFEANIFINGKENKQKTSFNILPTKISGLIPGNYDIEIKKNGYRTWRDNLDIKPNMVTWANYVLLFADKLNISKINAPVGNVITRSENGRHILFASNQNGFDLLSIDTNNLTTKDFWPAVSPIEMWLASPNIQSGILSPSNDLALLRVTNGQRIEYIVSDARVNPTKLVHLNTTLRQDLLDAWWNITNNNELYVKTAAGISLVNMSDTSKSTPILSDAITFQVDESRQIFYIAKNENGNYSVDRLSLDGSNKTTLVDSVVASSSYKLGFSSTNEILSVLSKDSNDLMTYYIGGSGKKTSIKLSGDVTDFEWSKDGDYIYYWGKNFIKRYDWVKSQEDIIELADSPISVSWYFDENHFFVTNSKGIFVMDYDGSNVVPIYESEVSFSSLDTSNSNIVYSTKNESGEKTYFRFLSEF
jgi:hypothetical protein